MTKSTIQTLSDREHVARLTNLTMPQVVQKIRNLRKLYCEEDLKAIEERSFVLFKVNELVELLGRVEKLEKQLKQPIRNLQSVIVSSLLFNWIILTIIRKNSPERRTVLKMGRV